MPSIKLSATQTRWLDIITKNGRYGVGSYGGVPRRTAERLVILGLIEYRYERSLRGNVIEFAYPVAVKE